MVRRASFLLVSLFLAMTLALPARAADAPALPGKDKPVSVRLDPLTVSIQRNGVIERHIGFVIVLEVENITAQALIEDRKPKLIDAFVLDINALASLPSSYDNGIDPEALKRRLKLSTNRILGDGVVKNIVFLRTFTRKVS
jgi:flagellar basal body-associated protein FliL